MKHNAIGLIGSFVFFVLLFGWLMAFSPLFRP